MKSFKLVGMLALAIVFLAAIMGAQPEAAEAAATVFSPGPADETAFCSSPPPSCVCGSCCECYTCWVQGVYPKFGCEP